MIIKRSKEEFWEVHTGQIGGKYYTHSKATG